MFAYCGNNPVLFADPSGQFFLIDFIQQLIDSTILPAIDKAEQNSANKTGTLSLGANAGAACGLALSASIGITVDNRGNLGIIVTPAIGGGFPAASVNLFATWTNAPCIFDQRGLGAQVGGSIDVGGFSVGGEYVQTINPNGGQNYSGGTIFAGVGAPVPVELHGDVGYSYVVGFNIYSVSRAICNEIKGW